MDAAHEQTMQQMMEKMDQMRTLMDEMTALMQPDRTEDQQVAAGYAKAKSAAAMQGKMGGMQG